ncbi:NUDIX domain-containing protein [Novosphingobium sp.]|uniref:NUDIX domain-containing protein n=1 Tax=Novosphingobium sp. TaxID=1874826 RepID=UPI0025ED517B|nr:NUDIX domain-containing protein [Novosphingobium sp.]
MTALSLAWALRRWIFALLGVRTRGVKLLVENAAGEVLLVRNAYGKHWQWVLPGGGVGRRESTVDAAVRELREETGCHAGGLRLFATYVSGLEGRRDTIDLFRATTVDAPQADRREIAEAGFFALDRLPDQTSPATLRRLAEVFGAAGISPHW